MAVGKLRACASSQPHHRQGETLYKVSREISLYQIQVHIIIITTPIKYLFNDQCDFLDTDNQFQNYKIHNKGQSLVSICVFCGDRSVKKCK